LLIFIYLFDSGNLDHRTHMNIKYKYNLSNRNQTSATLTA